MPSQISKPSSQQNGGPSKAIGIGHTGPWGDKAPKPSQNPKPIKYAPMSGQYKGN